MNTLKTFLISGLLLLMSMNMTGCTALMSGGFDQNNQSQQLVVKTTIQLATATYLDKNSSTDSVNMVVDITNQIMTFLASEDVYNDTTVQLQERLHGLISDLDIALGKKIALTSLADVILSEAVAWAKIGITDTMTQEHVNVLFFCANTMNETAKLYLQPEAVGRAYSVNTLYEETLNE